MGAMKTPEEYWSIENMQAHTEKLHNRSDMAIVKVKQTGKDRRMLLLADPDGRGWYETQILREGKWVTMEEALFGKKIRKWKTATG